MLGEPSAHNIQGELSLASNKSKDVQNTPPPKNKGGNMDSSVQNSIAKQRKSVAATTWATPLAVVVTAENYPDNLLGPKQFTEFREVFSGEVEKLPPTEWPRLESATCREGAFILTPVDLEAKSRIITMLTSTDFPWEKPRLNVGGVELLQKMLKVKVRVPEKSIDPNVVLRRLEGYNPILKTTGWRVIPTPRDERKSAKNKNVLILQIPESQVSALEALNFRPFYHLGRLFFKISGLRGKFSETSGEGELKQTPQRGSNLSD